MADRSVAMAKLQKEVGIWEGVVDNIVSTGIKPKEAILLLKQTPLSMNLLGADLFKNLFIEPRAFIGCFLDKKTIEKGIMNHKNITPDILKKVPKALTDPIAVFAYEDKGVTKYAYILEIVTDDKATVLANIDFNAQKTDGTPITLVADVYTVMKNNTPDYKWIIDEFINCPAYCNRVKWRTWTAKYFPGIYEDIGLYTKNTVKHKPFRPSSLVSLD